MTPSNIEERAPNPRETANFISKLFFWYVIPVFSKTQKENSSVDTLYKPLKEHKSELLGKKLHSAWQKEVHRELNTGHHPKLYRAILRVFGGLIVALGFALFCLDFFLKITQPIFLGLLVSRYSDSDRSSTYYYAGAVVLCSVLNVLFSHSNMLNQFHCGMKIRVALVSIIYRKALRLSRTSLQSTTSGKILNLLTNDVGKIDNAMLGLHQIWLGPLETIVVIVLVYQQIGLSALSGILILGLLSPAQYYMGRKMTELRGLTAKLSDVRIRLMNEIIQGVQVIKMYAWERPFEDLVKNARKEEVGMIQRSNYIRGTNLSCMMFVSRIAIFTSLVIYALLGQVVTAEKAFVITAYYNILRQVMTVQFPRGIEQLGETAASLKRIEDYMLLDERKPNSKTNLNNKETRDPTEVTPLLSRNIREFDLKPILALSRVTAKWTKEDSKPTLDGITLTIRPGEQVALIGKVGSGKSSILQAILGELPITSGRIETNNATISYASQEPWLFNGTIQENILFGRCMDLERYNKVVTACALQDDFNLLRNGDQTLVGDRGQSLSGGQKARIGLARAVYREANIYLLDDPLSAVDLQVGRHLIDNCINKLLREQIVLLVTHQLQFLSGIDRIVAVDDGKINFIGEFAELEELHPEFKELNKRPVEGDELANSKSVVDGNEKKMDKRQNGHISNNPNVQRQNAESQKQGGIGAQLYMKYIRLGGGFMLFIITMVFCITTQSFASGSDYFLAFWVNRNINVTAGISTETDNSALVNNKTIIEAPPTQMEAVDKLPIYIFTVLTAGTILVTLSRTYLLFKMAMKASIGLHNAMYQGIIRAAMYFFRTNPVGRIMNRFSKDMGLVDEMLPTVMIEVIQIAMALIGVIVIVAMVNQWSLLLTAGMAVMFFYLRRIYLNTSRDLKRMDGITRSPIYSHTIETLNGLSTIHAFSAEENLIQIFDSHQDTHSSVFYTLLSIRQAFGFFLDLVCIIYIIFVTFVALDSKTAGEVGLAITQAIGVTGMLQWGVKQSAEMENLMTCVERIDEYGNIKKEGSEEEKDPPTAWPQEGSIEFENISLWYSPDKADDAILRNIHLRILPKEKVGIVGRTGAGKSSLVNAILRLAHIEGSIKIDGQDIMQVPLETLRRKISIIPQEPILFSGSLRYNLDPFSEYSDYAIWETLEQVSLKETDKMTNGLETKISEGGHNLSFGERQLICLARAILRENKILIMDEATANVDRQTDAFIQQTIREKFRDCTVLVIAHRLHTVMDLDRLLVMDNGRVVEFGPPYSLLTREGSIVNKMAKEAGQSTYDHLLDIAKKTA